MSLTRFFIHASLGAIVGASPALASTAMAADAPAPAKQARTFAPAEFARFAPKTAFDMLVQVPGFEIRGTSNDRGLGQASENILINGQRVADKQGGALAQLQTTPIGNVDRIEIVDASQLGIAGLTGQVANVHLKALKKKGGGNFEWRPEVRAKYANPNYFRGKASYQGENGPVAYTLAIDNQASRGAYGGGEFSLVEGDGDPIENRDVKLTSDFTQTKFGGRFKIDMPGTSVLNLSGNYGPYWYDFANDERVIRDDGDDRDRSVRQKQDGYMVDLNGDYSFGVGPGTLKLIGLRHFEHEPTVTTLTTTFDSGADDEGIRFTRDARIGETVLRGEYAWKSGKNDWQFSFERADNRLKQEGRLFFLGADGEFEEEPYPEGSGEVHEARYEGIASFSRSLTANLDLQIAGGAEHSTLERVDGDLKPRKFFRPKGSVTLGWRPSKGWDTSFSLKRKVGQISFYDFLSQPNLQQDRENTGNNDLVPPQSWEAEVEAGKELGPWGKTRLRSYAHRIDDIVDIIPIGEDGQGIGNIPRAWRWGIESTSTFQFDPIGWQGAKLDLSLLRQWTRVRDPLTFENRPISGSQKYSLSASLRHDVAGTPYAWGAFFENGRSYKTYFLDEIGVGSEGPFMGLFVEHKSVAGMTVRFDAINLNNSPHRFDRTKYAGRRDEAPVTFVERQREDIGPIFRLSVKGNF